MTTGFFVPGAPALGRRTGISTPPVVAAPVPVNTIAPSITGTATEGQTLTLSRGTYTNSPVSYTQQWYRAATAIVGATATTYVLAPADIGASITCQEVATNAGGPSAAATSNAIGPVAAALLTLGNNFALWGASNVEGNQDGTGTTIRTVAVSALNNPSNYLTYPSATISSYGVGGETMQLVYDRMNGTNVSSWSLGAARTTTALPADTILQIAGSNDFGGGVTTTDDIAPAITVLANMVGLLGHSRYMHIIAYNSTGPGSAQHLKKLDFFRRASAIYPGRVQPLWAFFRDPDLVTPVDSADQTNQQQGIIPPSKAVAGLGHANAAGYGVEGNQVVLPMMTAFQSGKLPFIPYQEVYSRASTNQTNGGFVGNVQYYGDLTGCAVDFFTAQTHLAIGVVGSAIVVTRATGTLLLDDYIDTLVRISKSGRQVVQKVRVVIGSNPAVTAPYKVNYPATVSTPFGTLGNTQRGSMHCPWVGPTNAETSYWCVFNWKMTDSSQDTTSMFFQLATDSTGISLNRQTTGALRAIIKDASGATAVSISNTGGTAVSGGQGNGGTGGGLTSVYGERWIFLAVDIPNARAQLYIDNQAHTTLTTAPGAGATTMAIAKPSYYNSGVLSPTAANCIHGIGGPWMEGLGYPDWSQAANRSLIRNSTTQAAMDLGLSGAFTTAAGVSAGQTFTPFNYVAGNAGDRYMGQNRGTGGTRLFLMDNMTARQVTV